jgi:hypothetical protein
MNGKNARVRSAHEPMVDSCSCERSITRAAFREELVDAGLRIDGAEHQDEAREDFRFLGRLRLAFVAGI